MGRIKVTIIGTGSMANNHANTLARDEHVELAACYDVDRARAEAYAGQFGVPLVADSLEQAIDAADAVFVVTPDRFHAAPTVAALQAGRHVLCEKPLAPTLAEAQPIDDAATEFAGPANLTHMTHFTYRGVEAFDHAAALIACGDLGELRHVHGSYLQSWLTANHWGDWRGPTWAWRLQKAAGSGGTLVDIGCHLLDFITGLAGDLDAVAAQWQCFTKVDEDGKRYTELDGGSLDANDSVTLQLTFANGAIGVAHASRWATGYVNQLHCEIHGTTGALRIVTQLGRTTLQTCLGADRHEPKWTDVQLEPALPMSLRFLAAARRGEPIMPDLHRGYLIQRYLDACERSAVEGGRVVEIG